MKKNLFLAGLFLVCAACSKESFDMVKNAEMEEAMAPVRVHVTDFAVETEDFPGNRRAATDVTEYSGVTDITLAFYKGDGTEEYKETQTKGAANFGEFECTLPIGSFTMVVVAYKTQGGSPFVLTSPTVAAFTGEHAFETFTYTQSVTINSTNAVDISATLSRIVSKLRVVSTDGRTADATKVRTTLSAGGWGFNPTTGFATSNAGCVNTVPISAAVGVTTGSAGYVFLTAENQTMNVTIETLDADDNTLFSKTVENVPFMRNRATIMTGAMYTNSSIAGTFKIETDWISDHNVSF